MVGDDILIYDDDELAHEYVLLVNQLGVNISPLKTLVGKDSFEFVKRVFITEGEISPISFSSFVAAQKDFSSLICFIDDIDKRGLPVLEEVKSSLVFEIYEKFCCPWYILRDQKRLRKRQKQISFNFDFVQTIRGTMYLVTLINNVLPGYIPTKLSDCSFNM